MWLVVNTCKNEGWKQIQQSWKADSGMLTADGVKEAEKMTRPAVSGGRTEILRVQES